MVYFGIETAENIELQLNNTRLNTIRTIALIAHEQYVVHTTSVPLTMHHDIKHVTSASTASLNERPTFPFPLSTIVRPWRGV